MYRAAYVDLTLKPVPNTGLEYYEVIVSFEKISEDGVIFAEAREKVLDNHWQESTARECAARWAKFYNCPVLGVID